MCKRAGCARMVGVGSRSHSDRVFVNSCGLGRSARKTAINAVCGQAVWQSRLACKRGIDQNDAWARRKRRGQLKWWTSRPLTRDTPEVSQSTNRKQRPAVRPMCVPLDSPRSPTTVGTASGQIDLGCVYSRSDRVFSAWHHSVTSGRSPDNSASPATSAVAIDGGAVRLRTDRLP